MKRRVIAVLAALALGAGTGIASAAIPPGVNLDGPGLAAVGPIQSTDGFPSWYKDKNGLKLEQCGVWTADAMCPPVGVQTYPAVFPGNYPDESFYSLASSTMDTAGSGKLGKALAAVQMEQAFVGAGAPSAGDQVTFARVRYIIDVPTTSNYTITSPTGIETLSTADLKVGIKFTEDIGVSGAPFSAALAGRIGPWLTWNTYPNDTALPNLASGLDGYIGDGALPHAIKGSPYNTNFFRIEGPGINPTPTIDMCPTTDGPLADCTETALFVVQGKVSTNGGVTAEKATYSRSTANAGFIDVFATSDPDAPQTIQVSGIGATPTVLTGSTATVGNYFAHVPFAGTLPTTVTVTNTSDTPDSVKIANVVDGVSGTANYDPATSSLTINAVSSDTAAPRVLKASGYAPGLPVTVPSAGLTVSALAAAPAFVTVTSDVGGSAQLPVTIGAPVVAPIPVVANAGPDQTVTAGQLLVPLSGSLSTGVITGYSWETPGITLSDPLIANPTFTAPAAGIYLFGLTVTGASGSSTDVVKITVSGPVAPGAPVIGTPLAGDTTATVNWTAPANGGSAITGYTVRVADAVTDVQIGALLPAVAGATSLAVTGLVNGTAVKFQVQATNAIGTGAFSALSTAVTPVPAPTAPGKATNLTGGNATPTSIDLSWTPPVNNGGSPIIRYALSLSTDNGLTWAATLMYPTVTNPAGTTSTWTGLTPSTSYQFRVTALNSAGWSGWSAPSPTVSTTPVAAPSAPLAVTGTPSNGKVSLTWQAPSTTGGTPITGYGVDYSSDGGTTWVTGLAPSAASTALSYTVTGLTNGTVYVFRVVAANAIGTGLWSATSPVYTPTTTAPAVATGVTGANATATSIDLSWTPPVDNGGSPIIRYALSLSTDNGLTWAATLKYPPVTNPAGTTSTWTGLTPGTSYRFRVTALNSIGWSGWSAPSPTVSTTP